MTEPPAQDALAFADAIVDTMRDPLLVLDRDLRVVAAGREFYRTFGVAPAETVGRLVYDLGNRQWDIPRLRELLEDILPREATFRDFEMEHTFEHIGRKVMLLNARQVYREDEGGTQILLVIEDVTDRRDAEEARRAAETRFTEMVKNVRDHSIFLIDPAGVITSWNVAAERVIGYPEAEAVGRHFALIFTPEDVAAGVPDRELRQAREEGRAEDERWQRRKDGTLFWALGIVTPLHGPDGQLSGFSKILRDITDRKRLEEDLRRARDDLERRVAERTAELRTALVRAVRSEHLAAVGQTAAGLAHESRNALQRGQACLAMLELRLQGRPEELELVQRARQAQEELERLYEGVRQYAAPILLTPAPCDLAEAWRQAWDDLSWRAGWDRTELTENAGGTHLAVVADFLRLKQVFRNLFENALASGADPVRIRVGWSDAVTADGRPAVRVSVRDNGPGLPRESLDRVFEPFFTTKTHGTGLGLAICRRIIEEHGGTLEAAEPDGPGAEFVLTLPRSAQAGPPR